MFDADILAWCLERGVSRSFLESLFHIRQALEPLGAASAALCRSAEDIEAMTAAWQAMCRPDHSRDSFTRADLAFHRAVLVASGNPFLQSMGAVIEAALAASFTISSPVDDPERFELSGRQHRAVLDAIVGRNPQEASRRMSEVIVQGARVAAIDRSGTCEVDVTIRLFGKSSG
jgi:DNA-binding FadR family transcriptional regulator